ncbi:MAG: radical SAM protein [Anaerolineales bacterium]|nr:radical SAM protein [Anaerolineales bacterium]
MADLVVVWRVTERCDLACRFCGYSRELRRPRRHSPAESVLAFGRVLAAHAAATGRRILLSWLGGEPALWPPLLTVGPELRGLGLQLGLTTNGTRLDPAFCAHLAEHYAQVTVSVDGLADWHDQVRGAPGLWARLAASIQRLAALRAERGAGPRLRANVVLMRGNLADFPALCERLAEWGVDEVTFNSLGGQERPGEFFERQRLAPEDLQALGRRLPALRAQLRERGLTLVGGAQYLDRLEAQARGQAWPVLDCAPGQRFLFVDEAGRAGPCSFTAAGRGVPIAELTEPAALVNLPELWRARFALDRPAPCADCRSTQVFGKFVTP